MLRLSLRLSWSATKIGDKFALGYALGAAPPRHRAILIDVQRVCKVTICIDVLGANSRCNTAKFAPDGKDGCIVPNIKWAHLAHIAGNANI